MFGWKADAVPPPANHRCNESGTKCSQHGGMAALVSEIRLCVMETHCHISVMPMVVPDNKREINMLGL